jgi:hypothetical protein
MILFNAHLVLLSIVLATTKPDLAIVLLMALVVLMSRSSSLTEARLELV